jgi:hypothetical protein
MINQRKIITKKIKSYQLNKHKQLHNNKKHKINLILCEFDLMLNKLICF